ncbi:MAG: diguanylate cyclase domain-containing protein, partial [Pontibacterium sp.]
MRKNVQIMFIGMSAEDSSAIVRLLRASRLAPRGHLVASEEEFVESLQERSWDVILCTNALDGFNARQAMHLLNRLDKDIPIVQLVPDNDSHYLLNGLKNNMQAVVPMNEPELLVIEIRRELERLDQRRQLRQLQSALTEAERQYDALLDTSSIPIAFLALRSDALIYANTGLAELLGFASADSLINTSFKRYLTSSEHAAFDDSAKAAFNDQVRQHKLTCTAKRADDTEFSADLLLKRTRHKGEDCLQATLNPRLEAQEAIVEETNTDLVSGVYSTAHFNEFLEETLNRALAGGSDCNLLYINLDKYLDIRTEVGIEGCDQIIRDIASLLKKHVNQAHFIARVEEDSFAVIFHDPSPDKALTLADKLCKAIEGNISELAGETIRSTASIGVTTISDNAPTRIVLLERVRLAADEVRAENQVGNGFQLYQHQTTQDEEANDQITQIERAVNENSMRLLFQPIVSLNQSSPEHHYEAFLRLLDENQKEHSPSDF